MFPPARADLNDRLDCHGYLQPMAIHLSARSPDPAGRRHWLEYRLQNRLNLSWRPNPDLAFQWQMRTRFFQGDLVEHVPGYAAGIDRDGGVVNLSWLVAEGDQWLLHYIPDRFYGEFDRDNWNIRIGRQRVNWGINMITNPNDIFNLYSFYDFDYPERPGSDAIRVQRHLGFASRIEAAASFADRRQRSVAAGLYAFPVQNYEVQLIGGVYHERLAMGAGWAGNLGGAGFKGETMFYSNLAGGGGHRRSNYIFAVSVDYMFRNSLFMVAELLYNQDGGRNRFQLMTSPPTPDNPSFSRYQASTKMSYPLHPLVNTDLALIYYPDQKAVFVSPSLTWSVGQNLDFQMLGQFFVAPSRNSIFSSAGSLVTASLKYNF